MAIILNEITNIGFYICYESHGPENLTLDEVQGFGREGFKSVGEAIAAARDLIVDVNDTIIFFGKNVHDFIILIDPFGYMSGEDFICPA